MGEASISLVRLELERTSELLVSLSDPSSKSGPGQEYLGQLDITLRLEPKKSSDRRSSVVSALSHSEKQVGFDVVMIMMIAQSRVPFNLIWFTFVLPYSYCTNKGELSLI